jgi:hypothetical protein
LLAGYRENNKQRKNKKKYHGHQRKKQNKKKKNMRVGAAVLIYLVVALAYIVAVVLIPESGVVGKRFIGTNGCLHNLSTLAVTITVVYLVSNSREYVNRIAYEISGVRRVIQHHSSILPGNIGNQFKAASGKLTEGVKTVAGLVKTYLAGRLLNHQKKRSDIEKS